LSGAGSLALKNYQIENFHLALAARRWPAIHTRRYQAQLDGDIKVEGPLAEPKLSGQITIIDSNMRPDLAFLERSSTSVKRDETIVVVSAAGAMKHGTTANNQNNGVGSSELIKNLAIDLRVIIPRNAWVRHPNAVAELSGNIHATKKPAQTLQLVGTSEIVRGWAAFQGRRFNFERGQIRFFGGGQIDPALDIVARHKLPQYTVDAVVGGTVSKPTLFLRSDPSLDQADILAVLLFGKPTKDLNKSEEASLERNAVDVAGGFAAAQIGSAVAEAIGLDRLGLGEIDFKGGRVGLGRYIGDRTYVTAGQELAGERGQEVKVEYQIAPDWKIGTSTTSKGVSAVDLFWQQRY
jgi:autotransporter translocation and assembly factor TamB